MMQFDAAIATYRVALAQDAGAHQLHSDLLLALNYSPDIDDAQLLEEHKIWAQVHPAPLMSADRPALRAEHSVRPLRIGYVSPDLREHPVAHFVQPLLAPHDRSAVHPIVYCDSHKPDEITDRLRRLVPPEHWRDVRQMSDDQLDHQIRQDGIDILVDLAGHTGRNRLAVFARKPAPLQITYLGYPNTTGLPREVMRYRLTDAHCDPPGMTESLHTEELVRLPDCFICYQPSAQSPDVSPVPCTSEQSVTFGSFNAMQKISGSVIELWSKILLRLPGSRLALKNRTLGDSQIRRTLYEMFARHGVRDERLILIPPMPTLGAHFSRYAQIDVCLDPFPYNGTTTTCDALWMGVPVITLEGKVHRSRVGISLLRNVGLQELIAQSPEHYEQLAVDLARDVPRRTQLRKELRERVRSSPLTDAAKFARNLEQIYKAAWSNSAAQAESPRHSTP
jgi:predicted O-linked N-acetylglucosamine transferase (SPINDLY family)